MFFKKVKLLLVGAILVSLSSCSDDDPAAFGTVNLKLQSTISNLGGIPGGRIAASDVIISDFRIAIRDVGLKFDNSGQGSTDTTTNIIFNGPYQLDLLDGTEPLIQSIGEVEVPNGVYSKLRFVFHKSEELPAQDKLFDRSIFISGTIKSIPFEMWHDTSENFDVAESTGFTINGNYLNIIVNFNVDQFINAIHEVDLSNAIDGNGDGMIEINTNDNDGNKELVDLIKDNIKASADLIR